MRKKFLGCLDKPFEVHYDWGNKVGLHMMEFASPVQNPTGFSEVKAVHEDIGFAEGVSFECDKNSGEELIFCLLNKHKGVAPEWLKLFREEDILTDIVTCNYYSIHVKDEKFSLELMPEGWQLGFKTLWACGSSDLFSLDLRITRPSAFVLDSEDKRIVVDPDGIVLDSEGNPTSERLFTPAELEEFSEKRGFGQAERLSLDPVEAKQEWIVSVLAVDFYGDIDPEKIEFV
jgi:hypothetical protein